MRIFIGVAVICLCIFMLSGISYARDLEETGETVYDTLRGANGSAPMLYEIGVAKIWEEPFGKKFNLRTELDYQCSIDNLTDNNQVKLRTIFEF